MTINFTKPRFHFLITLPNSTIEAQFLILRPLTRHSEEAKSLITRSRHWFGQRLG